MKKVIIALDYDPTAEKVARVGYDVAKSMNAAVLLLHVVNEPSYYESGSYSPIMGFIGFTAPDILEIDKGLYNEAKRYLEESKKHLGDDTIEIAVLEGDFTEAINAIIDSSQADLLVMGTHSRKGLEKLLMGNLAEKILNSSRIPLLTVPTHTDDKQ
jgi:nucleotide-binding universal stress UspA family protein